MAQCELISGPYLLRHLLDDSYFATLVLSSEGKMRIGTNVTDNYNKLCRKSVKEKYYLTFCEETRKRDA